MPEDKVHDTTEAGRDRQRGEVMCGSLREILEFGGAKNRTVKLLIIKAKVAELADAPDLGSGG